MRKRLHNKTYVFLPIESTNRELDYKINLARLFCKEGLEIIIGHPGFIRHELKYINYRGIFLEKGPNPAPEYYGQLLKNGIYLYDLSDEGASEPVYSITYPPAIDALKCMRTIFLWGHKQKRDLIERNPDSVLAQKYKVIGNPAFDLSTPKYNEFHKQLKPKSLPESFILVNTNFGCYQSFSFEEQLKACPAMSPETLHMIRESYRKEEKQFKIFREWLEKIITSFPNEIFLIRPHPCEIKKNYEKVFGKYKNVIVSKQGNVNQVIASAKLVLHKDCSTAMQSYLMGIPAISLADRTLQQDYAQWPLAFSVLAETVDQALAFIEQALRNKGWDSAQQLVIDNKAKEILDDNFHHIGHSTRELVNHIITDAKELMANTKPYELIDLRSKILKLKVFIRRLLPLHFKVPKAARPILIKFSKNDIQHRLNLLEAVDPIGSKFKVKKVFLNAYRITKEMN